MRFLPWVALAVLASCGGGGGGGDNAPAPPVQAFTERAVSGTSPFAGGCGGTGGTVYINAEVEPHLAVDPRDGNHLIAAWQQDRWSNGSARGVLSAMSLDGGATWTITQVPFSQCSGGTFQNGGDFLRATDPWVAIATDGTAYQMALVTNGNVSNAMAVSRSTDGGRTWSNPVALRSDGAPFLNDKNTITADPNDARFVYAIWDRVQQGVNGPTWFARTTDGGATWEPARMIYDAGPSSQTIGNLIRVLPSGPLVNVFVQIDGPEDAPTSAAVRVMRSADRGATWGAPVTVAAFQGRGVRDPVTGQAVRDGAIVPQMAVGPDGTLHVVWQDARFTGQRDAIAYSRSADGGATWSAPVRVNANASVPAFTPQVHVLANGTVGVSFYDFRSDTPAPDTLLTDYWLARSTDGVNWSETRIAGPFDLLTAPNAGGLFLGDYMGLAGAGTTFLSLHTRTTGNTANRTDIWVSRIAATAPGLAYPAEEMKRGASADPALQRAVAENIARSLAARRAKWGPHS